MTAELKFVKHIDDYHKGYNPSADGYVTIDPLRKKSKSQGRNDYERKNRVKRMRREKDVDRHIPSHLRT